MRGDGVGNIARTDCDASRFAVHAGGKAYRIRRNRAAWIGTRGKLCGLGGFFRISG